MRQDAVLGEVGASRAWGGRGGVHRSVQVRTGLSLVAAESSFGARGRRVPSVKLGAYQTAYL